MLKPTKYSHPDKTVIAISSIILERLRKRRLESYDDLLLLLREKGDDLDSLFLPSLAFLFLLELIKYLPKLDSFEYAGPNQ